jgi:hypothetical protein
VILSTMPGEQATLASANARFAAILHPNGLLNIKETSTGQLLFSVGPFSISCKAPYKLVIMANGQLVLQDKAGTIAWASTSACRGSNPTSTCYTYDLQADGQLVVFDVTNTTVWSSRDESGSAGMGQGWLYQITSRGLPDVRCISSGPSPAAVKLVSQGKGFTLQISQRGAELSLQGADGSLVRSRGLAPTCHGFLWAAHVRCPRSPSTSIHPDPLPAAAAAVGLDAWWRPARRSPGAAVHQYRRQAASDWHRPQEPLEQQLRCHCCCQAAVHSLCVCSWRPGGGRRPLPAALLHRGQEGPSSAGHNLNGQRPTQNAGPKAAATSQGRQQQDFSLRPQAKATS